MNNEKKPPSTRGKGSGNKKEDDDNATRKILLEDLGQVIMVGKRGQDKEQIKKELDTIKSRPEVLQEVKRRITEGLVDQPKDTLAIKKLVNTVEQEGAKEAKKEIAAGALVGGETPEGPSAKMSLQEKLKRELAQYPFWSIKELVPAIDQAALLRKNYQAKPNNPTKEDFKAYISSPKRKAEKKILRTTGLLATPAAQPVKERARERAEYILRATDALSQLIKNPNGVLVLDIKKNTKTGKRNDYLTIKDVIPTLEQNVVLLSPNKKPFKEFRQVLSKLDVNAADLARFELLSDTSESFSEAERKKLPLILHYLDNEDRVHMADVLGLAQNYRVLSPNSKDVALAKKDMKKHFLDGFKSRLPEEIHQNPELMRLVDKFAEKYVEAAFKVAFLSEPPEGPGSKGPGSKGPEATRTAVIAEVPPSSSGGAGSAPFSPTMVEKESLHTWTLPPGV